MPTNIDENIHKSVLLAETLEVLKPQAGEIFVDATLGLGGHTEKILENFDETRVLGIDQDAEAIAVARQRLDASATELKFFNGIFPTLNGFWMMRKSRKLTA
jgi:16S rRNA (cytosine1402-N4)-methyltransferase